MSQEKPNKGDIVKADYRPEEIQVDEEAAERIVALYKNQPTAEHADLLRQRVAERLSGAPPASGLESSERVGHA